MEQNKNAVGVIGLAVMGANLAMNIADNGFRVAAYNRSREKTDELKKQYPNANITAYYDINEFINSLAVPRKIILMVQAGEAVDAVLEQIRPLLNEGDVVVDGGNSFFKDTIRREQMFKAKKLYFVGMGISGGEEGARRGPSLMPGGEKRALEILEPFLTKIAAKDFAGNACVTHVGRDGAGHYVKMIHNGIEYIDMQLIGETYWLMKNVLKLDNEQMAEQFAQWNAGRLNSYLMEITAKVLKEKNTKGEYLLDKILDSAGSKGTGKWTSQEVLDLEIGGAGIVAAVLARNISSQKKNRLKLSEHFLQTEIKNDLTLEELESALYVSKILAYAQGYEILFSASKKYAWNLQLQEISRIWQGGCIIRAQFLQELEKEFLQNPKLDSLLLAENFMGILKKEVVNLRKVAQSAIVGGLPIPAMLAGISYFDQMTSAKLSANLLQAQRDYFGAHTFQIEIDGPFVHHNWQ